MSATVVPFPSTPKDPLFAQMELVRPIARRLARTLPKWIPVEDLAAEGLLALVRLSAEKPALAAIHPYACQAVKGAMLDLVRIEYSQARKPEAPERCSTSGTADMLELLPDRERQVIQMRLDGLTQREIGEKLGISQPAARKIEVQAIERLRAAYRPQKRAA